MRRLFDRAAEHGNRALDFFGSNVTLPPEARFGSVDAVKRYVDEVLALPVVRTTWPGLDPVAVRSRRGVTAAHYEWSPASAVIAVPEGQTNWALRELVVLHELAHHVTRHLGRADPSHGPDFATAFCQLAAAVMGSEVGFVLRVVYGKEGVQLGPSR